MGSPGKSSNSVKDRFSRGIGGGGLLVALVALVFSGLGYGLAKSVQNEQQDVVVDAASTTNPRYDLLSGQGINISISNESLRAIIVDRIEVSIDGTRLASSDSYLPDSRLLEQHTLTPDRLATDAQPLPLTVDARSARSFATFFPIAGTVSGGNTATELQSYERAVRFCQAVAAGITEPPPRNLARLSVTIHYLPDGSLTAPLVSRGPMDERYAWFSSLGGPLDSPNKLIVWRKLTEPTAVREVTMKLWSAAQRRPYVAQAALLGSQSTPIPLPSLSPGIYRFLVFDGAAAVNGGRFRLPLKGPIARNAEFSNGAFDLPFCQRIQGRPSDFLSSAALKQLKAR